MMEDNFDYASKKNKGDGELEVTGVSRSGRVRKKSSKLTDFESLDEIDMRTPKIKKDKFEFATPVSRLIKKEKFLPTKEEMISDDEEVGSGNYTVRKENFIKQEDYSDESENDMVYPTNGGSSADSLGSEDDEDNEGFQPIAGELDEGSPTQSTSLYGMEKSSKKKLVITDGKILGRMKAQRKDKGKTRFTAYMLWAKEIRSELTKHNPELDFSQTSKKLGELWASVPYHEKYIWKRRAKRQAAKGMAKQQHQQQQAVTTPETKKMKPPPARKFINKQPATPTISNSVALSADNKTNKVTSVVDTAGFKPVTTTALDVSAYLRLLGESLTIIGERLCTHEGAIAGVYSVVLDSLLCALGPLLCLTQQVPQLNVIPQEQLSQLMDNIAHIMPGL